MSASSGGPGFQLKRLRGRKAARRASGAFATRKTPIGRSAAPRLNESASNHKSAAPRRGRSARPLRAPPSEITRVNRRPPRQEGRGRHVEDAVLHGPQAEALLRRSGRGSDGAAAARGHGPPGRPGEDRAQGREARALGRREAATPATSGREPEAARTPGGKRNFVRCLLDARSSRGGSRRRRGALPGYSEGGRRSTAVDKREAELAGWCGPTVFAGRIAAPPRGASRKFRGRTTIDGRPTMEREELAGWPKQKGTARSAEYPRRSRGAAATRLH